MMDGDGAGAPGQRNGLGIIDVVTRGIHRAAEHTVGMVIEGRTAVTAGDDHQRAVLYRHVVEHHADGGEVVIGVGIERPVLMPLDGRAKAGTLHVQLGGVEPDIRPPEVLQHGDDPGVPGQRGVGRIMQVRCLDTADARVVCGMAILQVINIGMPRQPAGSADETVRDIAEAAHLVGGQNVRDDDGTDLIVFVDLGSGQHVVLRALRGKIYRWPPGVETERSG